jgi:DNA polymerase-3 subunit delta
MTYEQIIAELKSKQYKPVYFLQGEESYFIDEITNYVAKNVLDASERDFNQVVMYGKDTEISHVIDECRQYPLMASFRVVIVKEAQELSRTIAKLEDYMANPTETTILVINYKYKKLDGKTKMAKALKKADRIHTFDKVRDYKMPDWIIQYGKFQGYTISPKAAMLLTEYLGEDLGKVVKTIDKLKIVLQGETLIDDKVVFKNVGISKEYNVFELQKALGKKDIYKSNLIANHFAQNPKNYPTVVTVGILYGYFSKLLKYHDLAGKVPENMLASKLGTNPYFIKDYAQSAKLYPLNKLAKIIGYLRQADLQSKGVGVANLSESDILREMVYKILH